MVEFLFLSLIPPHPTTSFPELERSMRTWFLLFLKATSIRLFVWARQIRFDLNLAKEMKVQHLKKWYHQISVKKLILFLEKSYVSIWIHVAVACHRPGLLCKEWQKTCSNLLAAILQQYGKAKSDSVRADRKNEDKVQKPLEMEIS